MSAVPRNLRTYPLSLKTTSNYPLNAGVVSAYDFAGNPNNAYAGGNGAPHVGTNILTPETNPTVVNLGNGIYGRDTSEGKTVQSIYMDMKAGALGIGAADGKGNWTIGRRYRAPSAHTGVTAARDILCIRDGSSGSALYFSMIEQADGSGINITISHGASAVFPPSAQKTSPAFRIPYNTIFDVHLVRNGTSGTMYLNGAPIATVAMNANLFNTNWNGIVTSAHDGVKGVAPADLILIDAIYWNRSLSDAEVAQHQSDPYAGYINTAVVADGIQVFEPLTGATVNEEGFTVSGTYQGAAPTAIEARFNNGAWVTIATSPTGGAFSGTMPAVARATGTLDVRYTNNTAISKSVANITANPPAPSLSITSQPPPDGQSVTFNTSYQRADSIIYSLTAVDGGAVSVSETVAVTYNKVAANGTKTFTGVTPGNYTSSVTVIGPKEQVTVAGSNVSILGVSGGGAVDTPTTAATVPGVPTNLVAQATDTGVTLFFNPPVSDGGSPITHYVFTASTGQTFNATTSPVTFTLPQGISVSFTGKAVNGVGPSTTASQPSNTVAPGTVPGAPTNVVASLGSGGVSISYTNPVNTGGFPIIKCRVTASTGYAVESTNNPVFIGMEVNSPVIFTVEVTNQVGYGPATTSNTVAPVGVVANPPTGLVATARNKYVMLYYIAPTNTGTKPVLTYRVTASTGQVVESNTVPIRMDATNDVAVTYTMETITAIGASAPSSPSVAVVPRAPFVRLKLLDESLNPMANLTGLSYAWFDSPTLNTIGAPVAQGANETTDANGELIIQLPESTLWTGQIGRLAVSNDSGNPSVDHRAFNGAMAVE